MRVLDLFAGLGGWSAPAIERGHDVRSVDLDPRFEVTYHHDLHDTAGLLELLGDWRPDLVLASPPCESFSTMTLGRNWTRDHQPKTQKAADALRLVEATRRLIEVLEPAYFIIENPRAKLRKLPPVQGLERRTVTYCQFGEPFQKPTDLWGGFPPSLHLPPTCKPKADCHIGAARGSRTGIQGTGVLTRGKDLTQRKRLHRLVLGTQHPTEEQEEMLEALGARPRGPGNPDPAKPRTAMAHASREVYGTWNKPTLAALRAVIPAGLSLLVLEAAERDLVAGRAPIATTLGL